MPTRLGSAHRAEERLSSLSCKAPNGGDDSVGFEVTQAGGTERASENVAGLIFQTDDCGSGKLI